MNGQRLMTIACLISLAPTAGAVDLGPVNLRLNLQYDVVRVDDAPAAVADVDDWRRQEVALSTKLLDRYDLKVEYDFNSETWTDVFVRLPMAGAKLTVGQFKIPFGADALSSSSQLLFTESSVGGLFAPSRRAGVQYARNGDGWGVQTALYGQNLQNSGPDFGIAARGWIHRGAADTGIWHLALAGTQEAPQDNALRFRLRPEIGSFGPNWVDSGSFSGVDDFRRSGVEFGYQRGRLSGFGEWFHTEFDGDQSRSARGGTLQASWTVAGKPRAYDPGSGLFNGPKPGDGLGQLELALRYNRADLPRAAGGEVGQRGVSVGANLLYGKYLRLMLDRHLPERRLDDADAELWTFRVAVIL
jgi:phosphate-selective porin OprO/OprP